MHECTNNFPVYGVLGNPIAPILSPQDREMLPPSHRTGYKRCSPSFREEFFSETRFPAPGVSPRPRCGYTLPLEALPMATAATI
jgi:hypothetical protein